MVAIQDPVVAASELYSESLVPWPIVENMGTLGVSNSEKKVNLLSAVRSHLTLTPSAIERFIMVLDVKLKVQEIAKEIEKTYQGELGSTKY